MVDETVNRASLILWQSRRQTLTALSAPEAEVVAFSEALMPSVVIHDACRNIGLVVGLTPGILFAIKTDSQVTLADLRLYIYICAVKLLSGPSLGFLEVIIWSKLGFWKLLSGPSLCF